MGGNPLPAPLIVVDPEDLSVVATADLSREPAGPSHRQRLPEWLRSLSMLGLSPVQLASGPQCGAEVGQEAVAGALELVAVGPEAGSDQGATGRKVDAEVAAGDPDVAGDEVLVTVPTPV